MEAAFFDLDKTVIAKSSVLAFGKPLYRAGLLSRRALLRTLYGQAVYRLGGADEDRMEKARDSMLSLLVSASPTEIVSFRAAEPGADECIASVGELDDDGRFTGTLAFYAYGPHKAAAIRAAAETQGIDLTRTYAHSDSVIDAPMLEPVGHPVAVNPDRDLARLAVQNGWDVRHFHHPVRFRLRERVPLLTPGPAVLAGGAIAAGLGWAGWRRARARAAT